MGTVLAYFLTWTTYGTWLHGDERGSVDSRHNARDAPWARVDRYRASEMASRMRDAPFTLSPRAREIVDVTIRKHCEVRGWKLHALNVRTNHVHVVLTVSGLMPPEAVLSQFKAWSTRNLRENHLIDSERRVWTEHGSTKWIDTEASLTAAIDYVARHQDLKGT